MKDEFEPIKSQAEIPLDDVRDTVASPLVCSRGNIPTLQVRLGLRKTNLQNYR